ncbi:NLR family CARD domain-containing protein 3 CARD15-like protein [Takifugu flavidus]|uniref:NLR family CARD domain-containing protein 3 CARD15-like protein n=1 Tax=Takifugu flavidus TaxID=433684 RepID=A0A5C6MF86_9TELE|nr:NLR family CARD domain-containing protein 3 CARD15-like protein [Takifugu flavidus]
MSECVMEEEERAESVVPSCVSMKSDWSKGQSKNFGIGPQGSPLKMDEDRAESTVSSWVSLKSDQSKGGGINFRSSEEMCQKRSASIGDSSCPEGENKRRTELQTADLNNSVSQGGELQEVIEGHKMSLKRRCEHVTEGTHEAGSGTLLNKIYTELYITEGQSEEVDTQHEVRQLERTSQKNIQDTPIKCQDIFKVLSEQQRHIRVVLTNGVAGVGKTFSVQKFSLDWAEGLENQDISLVLPLSWRELNLIRDEQHSLLSLLHVFHPTLQKIRAEDLTVWKLLFIFDGLDESRFSLGFNKHRSSLMSHKYRPLACSWITEVRGFTDSQKEEYFRRRFSDEDLSKRIISHIKASRSLHIMCLIPVFCWITAIVLEDMMTRDQRGELPQTLTDLYSHFLRVQMKRKKQKYGGKQRPEELTEADKELLLKLGWLAFEHLEKGNIMFYSEDLERCALDVSEVSVYSGVCTEIFKRESVIFQKSVYCFVHLSVQEFLAAVYMFHRYTRKDTAVISENGHLDLFVRFLHGLSLESNQRILGGLLDQTENHPETIQKRGNQRRLSEIHCSALAYLLQMSEEVLDELNLQQYNTSDEGRRRLIPAVRNCRKFQLWFCSLSEISCGSLASALRSHPSHLRVLDLSYISLEDPGVKLLCGALQDPLCELETLRELDLSRNHLEDPGVKQLCGALQDPLCKLETLSQKPKPASLLKGQQVEQKPPAEKVLSQRKWWRTMKLAQLHLSSRDGLSWSCGTRYRPEEPPTNKLFSWEERALNLSSVCLSLVALKSNLSHLRVLDPSFNTLQDSGVKRLCSGLESPNCKLERLRLICCSLSEISCGSLASALRSNPSHLRELDLSQNQLQDSGVKLLCGFLHFPNCRLETLSSFRREGHTGTTYS